MYQETVGAQDGGLGQVRKHPGPARRSELPEEAGLTGLERMDLAIVEDELDGGDERALAEAGQEQKE